MCVVERLWVLLLLLLLLYVIITTTILIKIGIITLLSIIILMLREPPATIPSFINKGAFVGMFAWVDLDSQGLNKILHQTKSTDH